MNTDESKNTHEDKVPATELSEQDLGNVAGGSTYSTSKSNIKASKLIDDSAGGAAPSRAISASGVGK